MDYLTGVYPSFTQQDWIKKVYPNLKQEDMPTLECIQEAGEILYIVGELSIFAHVKYEDNKVLIEIGQDKQPYGLFNGKEDWSKLFNYSKLTLQFCKSNSLQTKMKVLNLISQFVGKAFKVVS